ncbi:MAG: DUF547 domain-containing protein [Bdellovibrionales bacterium]|jgi:hypothetical protein|nr:DUF547 domain-containing protein [Bdellovibrionales bacterium]MBT3525667.1 DUF547 domain-containing protein [Bdellovibrionales bacterium]MBT7668195.1 DUF547 domain-containing protein [Bdellovibrionales bacterium]MBT7768117.1 DUF547 domain-containing protein [Bdellovibrionales bacterium]
MLLIARVSLLTIFLLLSIDSSIAFDHEHQPFDQLLQKIVKVRQGQSLVNYRQLAKDRGALESYLQTISAVTRPEFNTFSSDQQLAFLINSYNAFTLKLIVDHYPVKSIKDIGSFFTSAWKLKFFTLFGKKSYLDQVEHQFIRKNFKEPRIHFAVNCASIGCPSLGERAFVASKLELQLEAAATHFLQNRTKNILGKEQLYLSKIFDWYGDDFIKSYGSVEQFVAKYITDDATVRAKISGQRLPIDYLDYNWKLNEQ